MTQKVSGDMLADNALVEITTTYTPTHYLRVAANGSLEQRTPAQVRSDIGAGTGAGTVTSVDAVNTTGITWSGGPITTSGSLTATLSANLQAWHALATSAKQNSDATLTALASADWAANAFPIGSGVDTVAQVSFAVNTFPARASTGNLVAKAITDFALTILDDANAATVLATIGAQPLDATLTALAAVNWAANSLAIGSGADTVAQVTFAANTFPARASTGNLVAKAITDFGLSLVDDADATTARATLGVDSSSSGTYTPVLTNITNVAASNAYGARWMRIGNQVTVSGLIDVDPTAATLIEVDMTLPIASNFVGTTDAAGVTACSFDPSRAGSISSNATTDKARLSFTPTTVTNQTNSYTYMYTVL